MVKGVMEESGKGEVASGKGAQMIMQSNGGTYTQGQEPVDLFKERNH